MMLHRNSTSIQGCVKAKNKVEHNTINEKVNRRWGSRMLVRRGSISSLIDSKSLGDTPNKQKLYL